MNNLTPHRCTPKWVEDRPNWGGYGAAIDECIETDSGEFWVENSEYSTRVNYCPFCGLKAPKQVGA